MSIDSENRPYIVIPSSNPRIEVRYSYKSLQNSTLEIRIKPAMPGFTKEMWDNFLLGLYNSHVEHSPREFMTGHNFDCPGYGIPALLIEVHVLYETHTTEGGLLLWKPRHK